MPSDSSTTEPEERRRWFARAMSLLVASAVIAAVVGITALREDDRALFHSARNASDWGHHVIRIQMAEVLKEEGLVAVVTHPRQLLQWLVDGDHDFPPLLHATAAVLGFAFGHDTVSVQRTGLWWMVLLCLATGWIAWNISDSGTRSGSTQQQDSRFTVACAAAAATALIPAHHAAALNYYYDLPMTALLWITAAAVLALRAHAPVLPGLVGGLGVFFAGLMKWTALPAALPLFLGVLASPPGRAKGPLREFVAFPLRKRILTGVLAASTTVVLLLMYWRQSPRSWNRMLSMTYGNELDPSAELPATSWLMTISETLGRGVDAVSLGEHVSVESTLWYLMHFVFTYVSPLLFIPLCLLTLVWLWRGSRGRVLVGVTTTVHGLLLICVFTSLDERFLLSLGPIAALIAALGWVGLPGGLRQALAVALVSLGLWVAWDFHHTETPDEVGLGRPAEEQPTSTIGRIWSEIEHERRGLGLQTAVDRQWGWVRADYLAQTYFPNRELVWASGVDCGAQVVLTQEDLMNDAYGDGMWWTYRTTLERTRRGHGYESILGFEGDDVHRLAGEWLELERAVQEDRVIAISRGDGSVIPTGPLTSGWQVRAVVQRFEPEGPSHLALWTPVGSRLCPQWSNTVVQLEGLHQPEPSVP